MKDNGSVTEERDPPLMVKNAKYISGKKVKVDGKLTVSLQSLSWKPLIATQAEALSISISAITGEWLVLWSGNAQKPF
jgi:hypothetical protein